MKSLRTFFHAFRFATTAILLGASSATADFTDKSADPNALPKAPPEFRVSLFAREPLVRQPCSMAFDERGRLFVGMGPQYRKPKPDTPGDSVVLVLDADGDGEAETTRVFATGFNAIQGLAWHGRDLWVANAPDLTIVRDVDGDDEADQYVKLYTDLGNLEHGLHGLNWAPDGKLYMSKGNSKGMNQPGRYAPKPFRDLWGLTAPEDVPDFPAPDTFSKDDYRHAYHNPSDDWGMDGGVLRCDDGGHNLEIVSRGFRNPWDITMDSGFNWLGTDNDQSQGDRVFTPFYGAHFGWNHPWSSHWSPLAHAPTAPVSGPLFQGSGTGVIFCTSPQFPPSYRGAFLVNDWLSKKTYLWRPTWDGATMRPDGGDFIPFIEGGTSLFRPTDLEFGPDGALWVLGWSSGYGAEYEGGELSNEGRIFRIVWKNAPPAKSIQTEKPLKEFSIAELVGEFDSPLPVRRINAQDELVRRGGGVAPQLLNQLATGKLTENQETWTIWSLGRMPNAGSFSEFIQASLQESRRTGTPARSQSGRPRVEVPHLSNVNLQVQAVRILSYRANQYQQADELASCMQTALRHRQPRVRFAAVQAIHEARQTGLVPELLNLLEVESDPTIYYAGWQALRTLSSTADRRTLLTDSRAAVRRAALLSLLETQELSQVEVEQSLSNEVDPKVRQVADMWTEKMKQATGPAIKGRSLMEASGIDEVEVSASPIATIRNLKSRSGKEYTIVPGGFVKGNRAYVDRNYRLTYVPPTLAGGDLIQTANGDESSRGDNWLTAEAVVPVRVWVGIDEEQEAPPTWLTDSFKKEPFAASIDEGAKLVFYSRAFDAGSIVLGGNTDNGDAGSMVNYLVCVAPLPLNRNDSKATTKAALAMLDRGNRDRGEVLFRHSLGAGCAKCHSLDESKNAFGPNLSNIGSRSNARHIVQSIVEPSEIITEGFNQQTVVTDDGKSYSGVLLEESGLTLLLGQSTGEQIAIPKSCIEGRNSNPVSAMPEMAETLTPLQVADLTTFLLTMKSPGTKESPSATAANADSAKNDFYVERQKNQLRISLNGKPIVEFVFRDSKIRRPYFSNARLLNGLKVTRNHPPIQGVDELDHANLHPGIWLAFGDINGHDFWRNKAAMEHVRFVSEPATQDGRLRFATECRLQKTDGEPLCLLKHEYTVAARPNGWLLVWKAEFRADRQTVVLGDQEEMGFGARIATAFTEKNGGRIRSSTGKETAKKTWGQPASWCDYSGADPNSAGILLMASPNNFRESWWHNRNYGAFVSNPFGRKAMKQGEASLISIAPGKTMQITFGALVHDLRSFNARAEYEAFEQILAD